MANVMQQLLDPSRWIPPSLIMGWGSDLNKLQDFLTGRTFVPHWNEFELNWLASNNEGLHSPPPFDEMIRRSKQAWDSGQNSYYLIQPDTSGWHDKQGLGHYIRLLTMIVRENMAANGIWAIASSGDQLQSYFQQASVVTISMREEWTQKGKLFQHFKARGDGQRSLQPGDVAQPKPGESTEALSSGVPQTEELVSISEPNSQSSSLGSDPETQQIDTSRKDTATSASSKEYIDDEPLFVKQESLADKENNFLESLDIELSKKRVEVHNTLPGKTDPYVLADVQPAKKRVASDGLGAETKRRRSDGVNGKGTAGPAEHSHNGHTRGPFDSLPPSPNKQSKHSHPDAANSRHSEDLQLRKPHYRSIQYFPHGRTNGIGNHPESPANGQKQAASPTSDRAYSTLTRSDVREPLSRSSDAIKVGAEITRDPRLAATGSDRPASQMRSEDLIREACAYELKGMTCPSKEGCKKKRICLAYSRGEYCSGRCGKAHVLRSCKYKVKYGFCNKEDGLYNAKCTYGHHPIRTDMYNSPGKYH